MKSLLILFAAIVLGLEAFTPIENHVKWGYSAKRTSSTEAIIFLRAKIDDGWHIYSQHIPDGGPYKTKFAFTPSDNYKLPGETIEPSAPAKFDKIFKMNIASFKKEVVFYQRVLIKTVNEPVIVNVLLKYGACNAKSCLPPDEANFSITVPLK